MPRTLDATESGTPRRPFLRELLVFSAFIALTVLMTWPWAAHLRDAVSDAGDPYLNSWIMYWDFHQTFHDPLHLFDGNIFFPYKDSLAFSEHNYGIAVLFFPLYALGLRPLTAQSLATLLGFAFAGYGAFRLTRTLTGSRTAAWLSGIAFAFIPYRFHQISHINYLFSGWIPVLLEALVLHVRAPTRKRAAWLGAAFFMNALTCIHWFLLTLIPLGATSFLLLLHAPREGRWRRVVVPAALAVAIAGLLLLPFLIPYQRAARSYGFVRNAVEATAFSARPGDWLAVDPGSLFWRRIGLRPGEGERILFPGFVLLFLAAAALLPARRADAGDERDARPIAWIWIALGFLGSLGMNAPFHRALWAIAPVFRSIRVPARWSMIAFLGLAVLAGIGALRLARLTRHRALHAAIPALLALALLVEDRSAPVYRIKGDVDADAVTLWLKATPMHGGIVELPAGGSRGNYLYDLRAADHLKPLITGVSGFVPPHVIKLQDLTHRASIPDELMAMLTGIPASYVVVHESWLDPFERGRLHRFLAKWIERGELRFLTRFEKPRRSDVYAVVRTEPGAGPAKPLPWALDAKAGTETPVAREDMALTGSIDGPAEGDVVATRVLEVRGWARIPGEDLKVTILIDGEARLSTASARVPRWDVGQALPRLGSIETAGFEEHYPFQPGDEGAHEVLAIFETRDGRMRHYPIRRFTWRPGGGGQ